jgi:hypothetical protein
MIDATYVPKSERWWSNLGLRIYEVLDEDPLGRVRGPESERREEEDSFYEEEDEIVVRGLLGGKLGPKYILETSAEYHSKYDGLRRVKIIIKRDLHDFIGQLMLGARQRRYHEHDEDERQARWEYEVRFSLRFKSPYERTTLGAAPIKTLVDKRREAEITEEL